MARMTERTASLVELARRHGVATEYIDWSGAQHAVAATTLVAVLAALGVPADSEDECAAALADHERAYWQRTLSPTIVARTGQPSSFWVHVTHGAPVGAVVSRTRPQPPVARRPRPPVLET